MKQQVRNKLHGKAGFTLVELIVVIAILGILAGIGTVGYSGYVEKANEAADQQLLGYINTSFAAACLENGKDVKDITSADLSLTGPVGAKKVDSVSLYNNEFQKYYAGNEDSAFKVFTTIIFDSSKHVFLDAISAGYVAYDLGGGKVYIAPEDAANLGGSTFITADDLGVEGLMNKVHDVTGFVAVLKNSMMDTVFESGGFQKYMMSALGLQMSGETLTEEEGLELEMRLDGMIEKMRENNPTLYPDTDEGYEAARGQLYSNLAVMYSASNAVKMSSQDITSFLSSDTGAKEAILATLNDDPGMAISQAALAYGMYTAYAYSEQGNATSIGMTENPIDVVKALDPTDANYDEGFITYINSDRGQKDLQGYLSALNMINSSTGDSEAVSHVLVNGFADDSLKALISQAVEQG